MRMITGLAMAMAALACAAPPPVKKGPLIGGPVEKKTAPARPVTVKEAKPPVSAAKPKVAAKPKPAKTNQTMKPAANGPMAPYRGAIAVDAVSGRVLFADHIDRKGYPASVTKLMTLLLVLEDIKAGLYSLSDSAVASAFAAAQEPSSVALKAGQSMTIDDLMKSIMVKSANDAAIVLAEHSGRAHGAPADPPDAALKMFVERMNAKALMLGMKSTKYASPNGLPPPRGSGRDFDVSTAEDLAKLGRVIASMPEALAYTSLPVCTVTDGGGKPLKLQNHNHFVPGCRDPDGLCVPIEGCDGLKTGYTAASGSSIILTAERNGRRVVAVVLGSAGRHAREEAAGRILRDALDSISVW